MRGSDRDLLATIGERLACRPARPASALIDTTVLEGVLERGAVPPALRRRYERALEGVELPASSSHGDLRPANIGRRRDGSPVCIDWESYEARSSAVFDLIHYDLEQLPKARTWGDAVAPALAGGAFGAVCASYGVPRAELMLAYVAFRVVRTTKMYTGIQGGPLPAIDAKHARIVQDAAATAAG